MQYGFRSAKSCENALLNFLSKKEIAILLLFDFSKAFDMIEHKILMRKLGHYGLRRIVLEWFKSYLDKRSQYVTVNGIDSSTIGQ